MTDLPPIRPAHPDEVTAVAALIADAFCPLDVAVWLAAEPSDRRRILTGQFTILVTDALTHGHVDVYDDLSGAAIWFHRDHGPIPEPADYPARLAALAGPLTDRFRTLDDLFDLHHPTEPHHHLALLAITAGQQGQGRGGALLHHHHQVLDRDGRAAYLESSSTENRRLYQRHGYHSSPPFQLPDGPPMWPMWRPPTTPTNRWIRKEADR